MKYKAIVGFSGTVSASQDSLIDIPNKDIASDLLKAGYIEEVETNTDAEVETNTDVEGAESSAGEKTGKKSIRKHSKKADADVDEKE